MKITLSDYRNYTPEKSRTGGNYGFSEELIQRGKTFILSFFTTSEFEFCEFCGHFTNNCNCERSDVLNFHEAAERVQNRIIDGYGISFE